MAQIGLPDHDDQPALLDVNKQNRVMNRLLSTVDQQKHLASTNRNIEWLVTGLAKSWYNMSLQDSYYRCTDIIQTIIENQRGDR